MNMLNQLILEGNIANEVELIENTENTTIAKMIVTHKRLVKGADGKVENETSFFDVLAFGKLAENLIMYGKKGCGIRVVGRLNQNIYVIDGGKRINKINIVAEHIDFKPVFKNNKEE